MKERSHQGQAYYALKAADTGQESGKMIVPSLFVYHS